MKILLLIPLLLLLACSEAPKQPEPPAPIPMPEPPPAPPAPPTVPNIAILSWDANSEEDLAGYKVYHSVVAGEFKEAPTVLGKVTTLTMSDLARDVIHFFVITAYNETGESKPSNIVSKYIK